jgi:hypothetical protein
MALPDAACAAPAAVVVGVFAGRRRRGVEEAKHLTKHSIRTFQIAPQSVVILGPELLGSIHIAACAAVKYAPYRPAHQLEFSLVKKKGRGDGECANVK